MTTVFEIRAKFHRTTEKVPAGVVFGLYMTIPIEHISNWKLIIKRRME